MNWMLTKEEISDAKGNHILYPCSKYTVGEVIALAQARKIVGEILKHERQLFLLSDDNVIAIDGDYMESLKKEVGL